MRGFLLALALFSLSFANGGEAPDWVPIAFFAAFAGLGVLIIFFLLSYLVEAEHMRAMAISEMWQVFITMAMIVLFVGAEAFASDVVAPAFGEAFRSEGMERMTHMEYATNITGSMAQYEWEMLKEFTNKVVVPMGNLASLSGNCWLFGVSFTYNGCASINIPASTASFTARTMAAGILALNSQLALLNMAARFFFPVLLPIGLFLRSFHITRGTGGFLIAFAVAFYFVYPLGVLVTKGLYDEGADMLAGGGGEEELRPYVPAYPGINMVTVDETFGAEQFIEWDVPGDCDPFKTYDYPETDEFEGYGYTERQINNLLDKDLVDPLLYIFMFGGIFTPALNLVIALSVLRSLSRVFGTEVDVSALARIS